MDNPFTFISNQEQDQTFVSIHEQNQDASVTKRRRRWDEAAPNDDNGGDDDSSKPNNVTQLPLLATAPIDITKAAKEAAARINNFLFSKKSTLIETKEISSTHLKKDTIENEPKKELKIDSSKTKIKEESDDISSSQYAHIRDPLFDNSDTYFKIQMSAPDEDLTLKKMYFKNIEVNDSKHRFVLMRKDIQNKVSEETGAKVETKGKYYADKSEINEYSEPPLYIKISSEVSDGPVLEALTNIKTLIQKLIAKEANKPQVSSFGYYELKLPIGIESERGFNVRSKIIGFSGANVKAINTKTKARIQIKGRGSGYPEPETNMESSDDLFLHIMYENIVYHRGPTQESVEAAKLLCLNLISEVKKEFELYKRTVGYHQYQQHKYSSSFSSSLFSSAPNTSHSDAAIIPTVSADTCNGLYAYYYQYYFMSLGGNKPSDATVNDPSAIALELQQRQQYAAYYASLALNSATTGTVSHAADNKEDQDPLASGPVKDYRSVPPPPNLYK